MAILDLIATYIPVALAVIGAFASIAVITPNKSDNKLAQLLLTLVNLLGANIGKSKNAE